MLRSADWDSIALVKLIETLACGIDRDRYRLSALFLEQGGWLEEHLRSLDVESRVVSWGGPRDVAGTIRLGLHLLRRPVDILHQHFWNVGLRALARTTCRARIVAHFHDRGFERLPDGVRPARVSTRWSDAAVATSRAVAATMATGRTRVIYPGARLESPRRRPGGDPDTGPLVIGSAARLVPIKGMRHLIEAGAMLQARGRDVTIELAGDGPERARLEALAAQHGVADRVRFLGWQKDMAAVFGRWQLYVSPSLEEGFGLALLEAMTAELPVVATRVGGVPELIEHGISGHLVEPGSPAALSAGIERLLTDAAYRRQLAADGARRARAEFSPERMVAEISALYRELAPRAA